MTNTTILKHIKNYITLKARAAAVKKDLEKEKAYLIDLLADLGKESETIDGYVFSNKPYTKNSLDTSAIKNDLPDLYKAYLKTSTVYKFDCK